MFNLRNNKGVILNMDENSYQTLPYDDGELLISSDTGIFRSKQFR